MYVKKKDTKNKAENYLFQYLKVMKKLLGDATTYSDDLERVGKKLFKKRFRGVFSSDKIPILKKNEYIIINNEPSNKSGEHWLLAIKTNNNKIFLYDSFGRAHYKILPELNQSGNGIVLETENDPEQKVLETNCGQRCLAACMVYHKHGVNYFKWI